jgi:hypothetical protein
MLMAQLFTPADAWILTASGRKFWPFDPRREDVALEDIAKALSQICRFTGHCRAFYSVAQHSVHVSEWCDSEDALWGLLHDAAEAYIADIARPLKYTSTFDGYRELEDRLQSVVYESFGLIGIQPASVKRADLRLVVTERRDLMPPGDPWGIDADPLPIEIVPMQPAEAERAFLNRFRDLTSGDGK